MRRRRGTDTSIVFAAAATAYGMNCALGASVAARLVDTSRFRWVHHALYIVTCAAVAGAAVAGSASRSPQRHRAAVALLPAAVPLAVIPYAGTRGLRHPLIALAAAPFVLAGLLLSRSTDRK